jgi:hypothetical protein
LFKKFNGITAISLLLGLFPAFHLPTMQLMLVIVLIDLVASFRRLDYGALSGLCVWRNLCFAQFFLIFLINSVAYPVWDSSRMYYRSADLEAWGLGFLCLIVLGLWLNEQSPKSVRCALILALPIGLTVSFTVASFIYFSGMQGSRIHIFTPNALGPPMWFLVLTMTSFVWFFEMNRWHKLLRILLFFMAGMMIVYAGARLVSIAWIICSLVLILLMYLHTVTEYRIRALWGTGFVVAIFACSIWLFVMSEQTVLASRLLHSGQFEWTYENFRARFIRMKIWSGAWSVIADYPILGVGKANEHVALNQAIGWENGFKAHQTYLSYLIAGGVFTLLSGLIMQSSALAFIGSKNRAVFFPAFLGLGVVITLNTFTDSIFQMGSNVQFFMVATLIFLRTSDA